MYTIIIGLFSSLDYIFLAPTSFDFFYKFQIWKNLLQLIVIFETNCSWNRIYLVSVANKLKTWILIGWPISNWDQGSFIPLLN